MDQLSIDYAQEALREFSMYAAGIEKATQRQHVPQLVIYGDGSGHIVRGVGEDIAFSGLDELTRILQKKNAMLVSRK